MHGPGDRFGVGDVPAERGPVVPDVLELREARDRLGGHRLDRAGGDEVRPDAPGPDLLGEIPGHALQRRLGDTHPVVGRPGLLVVEVEPDERSARAHQRQERVGERLERVRRDVHGDRHVVPLRGEEVVAEARPRGRSRSRAAPRRRDPTSRPAPRAPRRRARARSRRVRTRRCRRRACERFAASADSARPAPVSTISAPSCCASRATPNASEASVRTPVITIFLPSSRPMQGTVDDRRP